MSDDVKDKESAPAGAALPAPEKASKRLLAPFGKFLSIQSITKCLFPM